MIVLFNLPSLWRYVRRNKRPVQQRYYITSSYVEDALGAIGAPIRVNNRSYVWVDLFKMVR